MEMEFNDHLKEDIDLPTLKKSAARVESYVSF